MYYIIKLTFLHAASECIHVCGLYSTDIDANKSHKFELLSPWQWMQYIIIFKQLHESPKKSEAYKFPSI